MTRIGLDLNSTALRGVLGPAGDYPLPLPLEPPGHDLPMILLLERSTAELGRSALGVSRQKGHLICRKFLPHVGEAGPSANRWKHGRRWLDADGALALVFQRLQPILKAAGETVLTLPGYIGASQAEAIRKLASKSKVSLGTTLSAPLAASHVAFAEGSWLHAAIVVDVDDHAMTLSLIRAEDGRARVHETRSLPNLSLCAWQDRVVNALADACVWQTRRDPRDIPAAEQRMYEQLESLFDAALHGQVVQIGVQGASWYQNLLINPSQSHQFCTPLLNALGAEIEKFVRGLHEPSPPVFILTHAAGRLPGLAALTRRVHDGLLAPPPALARKKTAVEDFGEGLLGDAPAALTGVVVLSADALARAAHGFHDNWTGHCEDETTLPMPLPVDAGPARVHFHGRNFYLGAGSFVLGSQPGCQLWFDAQKFPDVAGRHCDITLDKRAFVLNNRSPAGTFVNDGLVHHATALRAGDWIRLGRQGPTVRYLGQMPQRGPRATTA
jgi:hypothetical protein